MGDQDLQEAEKEMALDVKNSAYEIIQKKKATYYGIAMSVVRICRAIMKDEKTVMPVSTDPKGAYGIRGCSLSVPAIVGRNGVEGLVPVDISEEERDELSKSAEVLKANIASVKDVF